MKTAFSRYSNIAMAAGVLGFVSTFSQLFLVREFMAVFYGNEMVIGIILFSWIFLSGIGTYLAIPIQKYRSPTRFLYAGFMALAVFPMLSYVLLSFLYPLFIGPGELAGLTGITIIALLVLLPVCLLNGILFSLFAQVFQKPALIPKNYAFESLGGLAGGIVIYFWSGNNFESRDALFTLGLITIVSGAFLAIGTAHIKQVLTGELISLVILFGLAQTRPGERINKNTFGLPAFGTSAKYQFG